MAALMARADLARVEAGEGPAPEAAVDVLVILNPGSTRYDPEDVRVALHRAFEAAGLTYRIFEVPAGGDARRAIRRVVAEALEEGVERVVAVGGDGTVSMAGDALARVSGPDRQAILGIVPAGTANVLAGELGVPGSIEAAVAAVVQDSPILTLDAIQIGDRFCFTQVGVGPDAVMIRDTSRRSQVRHGRLAYMMTFVKRAFRQPPRRFRMELDGTPLRAHAWQIIVANAGNLGAPPFTWGPGIDPTDGVLDLCVFDVRGPRDYVRLAWRFLLGRHRRDGSARYFHIRESLVIASDRPVLVQGDGEVLGKTPVTLRLKRHAVRVMVHREVAPAEAPVVPPTSAAEAAAGGESVAKDVETMMATEHSRTWVLQGRLLHPVAALQALDAAIFLKVNALSWGLADRAAHVISSTMRYGEGWALVLFLMSLVDFRTGLRTAVEAVPVIGLTMLTVNYPLKRFFRRRRPFIAFVKARVFGTRPRDYSFPSGHAAAGFAGALVLGAHAPALAPLFYALAVVVSLSRVYLGVHYPSDVAFGGLLGILIAWIYRLLYHALVPWLG
jgi:diacylglycerol kinase family enzyme/membrane-associated phospholipid phosphatase